MRPFYEQIKPIRAYRQNQLDFPLHLHDAVEVVYVLQGSSTVVLENQRLPLGHGDLFLCFPNQVHGYENTQDFEGYVIIMTTKSLPAFQPLLTENQPSVPIVHPENPVAEKLKTFLQIMWSDRHTDSPLMLQGYGQVLLSKVLPLFSIVPNTNSTGTLQTILHYIDLHYKQPLTREEIANAVGYSPSHISHVFSGAMGMTLTEYITMLRMGEAKQLLRNTQIPVSRIAMQLGFSSIRSFNRFFMGQLHTTPTPYRRENTT